MRTLRAAVLAIVLEARQPIAGRAVAEIAGITRRQAADALVDLADQGLVSRIGRKARVRWTAPAATPNPFGPLELYLYAHLHLDPRRRRRHR